MHGHGAERQARVWGWRGKKVRIWDRKCKKGAMKTKVGCKEEEKKKSGGIKEEHKSPVMKGTENRRHTDRGQHGGVTGTAFKMLPSTKVSNWLSGSSFV